MTHQGSRDVSGPQARKMAGSVRFELPNPDRMSIQINNLQSITSFFGTHSEYTETVPAFSLQPSASLGHPPGHDAVPHGDVVASHQGDSQVFREVEDGVVLAVLRVDLGVLKFEDTLTEVSSILRMSRITLKCSFPVSSAISLLDIVRRVGVWVRTMWFM